MVTLETNRDLYLAVDELGRRITRSLEDYLRTLWQLGCVHRDRAALSLSTFASLLEAAAFEPVPSVEPSWSDDYELDGFTGWECLIRRQIVDLQDMARVGMLADEQRYFGINAPRGSRWYNFDPEGFLGCAVAGTYGGWEDGEPGRVYVPGKVVVTNEAGELISVDPRELEKDVFVIDHVSWDAFRDFLDAGQMYE
jgi:hypothetical protein